MLPRRLPLLLSGAALALSATAQPAPSAAAPPAFHMVQRIDEMLVGVDAIALDVVGRDHVAGTYFLVHAHKPAPLVGYANYVVDCRMPRRIAILNSVMPSGRLEPAQPFAQPPRRSGRVDPAQLDFGAVHVMDGTAMVAAFSCEASSAPGRAAQIAADLAARGGPADATSLYCQMQADSGRTARRVEVRYSEAENAVAVNGQWLSSGFLAKDEIVFGAGAQWRVDLRKRTARLMRDNGRQLFKGDCDTRPDPSSTAGAPR